MLRNLVLAGAVLSLLSACGMPMARPAAPGAVPVAALPKDRLIAAIEFNDCVLTAENVGAVMARANLTQAELTALTPQLQAEGRVEVAGSGAIRLLSDNCI